MHALRAASGYTMLYRWPLEDADHPGAMDHNGMLAAMTVEAATDHEVFLA